MSCVRLSMYMLEGMSRQYDCFKRTGQEVVGRLKELRKDEGLP